MLNLLRGYVEKFLGYASKPFQPLPPNLLTFVAFSFTVAACVTLLTQFAHSWPISASLLLLSGFFDLLDGHVARKQRKETKTGSFLDSMLDRYGDSLVIASIILSRLTDLAWGLVALIGSLLVSYARAKGESIGVRMSSVGIAERGERILIIAGGLYLAYAIKEPLAVGYSMVVLAILTHVTVVQRFIHIWRFSQRPT